jgi:hypothetical protein
MGTGQDEYGTYGGWAVESGEWSRAFPPYRASANFQILSLKTLRIKTPKFKSNPNPNERRLALIWL